MVSCKNVSPIDRILRVILGVVLIVLSLTGTIGVWGWIGIIPLITGSVGFCPIYRLLGKQSCTSK